MFYVYALLDPRKNNTPFYIGKGQSKDQRHLVHFRPRQAKKNLYKWNTIQSIQSEGQTVGIEIISDSLTEDAAYQCEEALIKKYGRFGIDDGGILTNRALGDKKVWSGMKRSPETCAKISQSKKGVASPLRGRKMSKFSEERRRKHSEARLGKVPWNKDKPYELGSVNGKKSANKQSLTVTGRKKKRLSDGSWKWIKAVDSKGYTVERNDGYTFVIFSVSVFAKEIGINELSIHQAISHNRSYHPRNHPYSYRFIDNDLNDGDEMATAREARPSSYGDALRFWQKYDPLHFDQGP